MRGGIDLVLARPAATARTADCWSSTGPMTGWSRRSTAERVADAVPGAVHIEIADANHILTTDKTDEVNGLLLAWFDKHS